MTAVLVVVVVLVALAIALAGASVRVLREYERGVVFRFGRLVAQKGPGLALLVPIADRMVRVTLRTITHTIPPQDVITRDNVPARVDAVAYFRVVDADASVVDIEDHLRATSEIAKTTLRSVLGKAELDSLLSERERLNEDLQRIIDEHTEPWGIKVVAVEIKDVGIPQDMQRAMARQAEAERDRRAMVINAEAEFQAASRLAEAAALLSVDPAALQLRYLQTLADVGKGEGSTVLLPLPLDVIGSVVRGVRQNGSLSSAHG
jgi:regulator of protease activity HflC (stomatin/prohibitin superfamily)